MFRFGFESSFNHSSSVLSLILYSTKIQIEYNLLNNIQIILIMLWIDALKHVETSFYFYVRYYDWNFIDLFELWIEKSYNIMTRLIVFKQFRIIWIFDILLTKNLILNIFNAAEFIFCISNVINLLCIYKISHYGRRRKKSQSKRQNVKKPPA